jgi:CTP:molybdopterin cytidylyltransferase MocA
MKIRGIIIAAGESSRFGSPKALLQLHGKSILQRLVDCLREGGCDEVLVVCGGSHLQAVSDEAQQSGARVVINENPLEGPVTSIRTGISGEGDWDAVLIHPVDVVGIDVEDVASIIGAASNGAGSPVDAWIISHGQRRGHPVVVRRQSIVRLKEAGGAQHLRALLTSPEIKVEYIVTENPLVLEDVDDPDDWERISAAMER